MKCGYVGLLMSLLLVVLLVGACATPSPTPPTATPTTLSSVTATPIPTSTPPATLAPTEAPLPTPMPTPTPAPTLRQLTAGGCCAQPFFSPDGRQVLFVDKPAPDAPVGVYGVDLAEAGSPTLIDAVIGFRSPDRTIVGTMAGDLVEFTQEFTNEVEAGESWQVNTGGNAPHFSPDASRILWSATDQEGLYDQRQSDLWLANLDGSRAIQLFSTYGGGFEAWFPDGQRLLLAGKIYRASPERTLFIYDLAQGRRTELFSHQRLRDIQLSPGGTWVALYVTFDDEEPALNGVWLVSTDGATQHKVEVLGFGAYRWQDDETLLYIPMRAPAEESMRLWAVEAATGKSKPLTDPAVLSFSIFNGDWSVSPDGRHIIFVNSADHNIWLITLP